MRRHNASQVLFIHSIILQPQPSYTGMRKMKKKSLNERSIDSLLQQIRELENTLDLYRAKNRAMLKILEEVRDHDGSFESEAAIQRDIDEAFAPCNSCGGGDITADTTTCFCIGVAIVEVEE